MSAPSEHAPGLWGWSRRHPGWHPGEWGAEVGSWAVLTDEALLFIDPLLDPGEADVLDGIVASAGERPVAIVITIHYHLRSAEPVWRRHHAGRALTIHGHPAIAGGLGAAAEALEPIVAGKRLPGGAIPHAIGSPRRRETPIEIPSHAALAFGDAVVGTADGLRVWSTRRPDDKVRAFHRDRLHPTIAPLAELGAERILTTHGPAVLSDGSAALRAALDAEPFYHPG